MWTPQENGRQNLALSGFHMSSRRWNSRVNIVGLLCFMVSKLLVQQGPWDTGLMHYVPSLKCQVCIYCSNYPLHIYRLNIDLEITHFNLSGISTGPNNAINFSQCFKAKFAAKILKGILYSDKQLTPYVRTVNNILLMEEMEKMKMHSFIVIKEMQLGMQLGGRMFVQQAYSHEFNAYCCKNKRKYKLNHHCLLIMISKMRKTGYMWHRTRCRNCQHVVSCSLHSQHSF